MGETLFGIFETFYSHEASGNSMYISVCEVPALSTSNPLSIAGPRVPNRFKVRQNFLLTLTFII